MLTELYKIKCFPLNHRCFTLRKPTLNRCCHYLLFFRLLNANKINCLRVDAFQDLHNLNLLSLYDNKLQTIAKGTFSPLRAIQTLYVLEFSTGCHVLQTFGGGKGRSLFPNRQGKTLGTAETNHKHVKALFSFYL